MNAIAGKIYAGVLAFSMLMFSNYQGNNAELSPLFLKYENHELLVKSKIVNGFENDFEQIFNSGKRVPIFFEVKISKNNKIIHQKKFQHTVEYDPMNRTYSCQLEEQKSTQTTKSFKEMINLISNIEYTSVIRNTSGDLEVELSSHLSTLKLDTLKKEIDLMLLWNFKSPVFKKVIKIKEYET